MIRRAVPSDAAAIHALHRAVVAEGRWFGATPAELPSLDARVAALRHPGDDRVLVDVDGFAITGVVELAVYRVRRARHVGRIELYVDPATRGRGIGRSLLTAALAEASPLRRVELAVLADNDAAIALYRAAGFVEEGRRVGAWRFEDRDVDELLFAWTPPLP